MTDVIKKNYRFAIFSSGLLLGVVFIASLFFFFILFKTEKFHASSTRRLSWQQYLNQKIIDSTKEFASTLSLNEEVQDTNFARIESNLLFLKQLDKEYWKDWKNEQFLFLGSQDFLPSHRLVTNSISISERTINQIKEQMASSRDKKKLAKLALELINNQEKLKSLILEVVELHYQKPGSTSSVFLITIFLMVLLFVSLGILCWYKILLPFQNKLLIKLEELSSESKVLAGERDLSLGRLNLIYEFLRTISYEARTPLNGIMGMSGLLLDTPLNERQKEYVNSINYSAEGVQTILNDIIDLAGLKSDELVLENEPIDFRGLVEDIIAGLSLRAEDKGVEIVLNYNLNLLSGIVGDAKTIRKIITNLVNILLDLSNDGIILLEVGLMETDFYGYKGRLHIEFSSRSSSLALSSTLAEIEMGGMSLTYKATKQMAELLNGNVYTIHKAENQYCIVFEALFNLNSSLENFEDNGINKKIAGKKVLLVDDLELSRENISRQLDVLKTKTVCFSSLDLAFQGLSSYNGDSCFDFIILNVRGFKEADIEAWNNIFKIAKENKTIFIIVEAKNKSYQQYLVQEDKNMKYLSRPIKSRDLQMLLAGESLKSIKKKEETIINFHEIKAIVVEDNILNQKVAVYMLQKMGCIVEALNDGVQILEKLMDDACKCDIIFMDCQMPIMDGFEASSRIRALNNLNKNIPIVALSANVMKSERDKCLEAGMNHFITKPLKFEDLKEAISIFIKPPIESGEAIIQQSEGFDPQTIDSEERTPERILEMNCESTLEEAKGELLQNVALQLDSIKHSFTKGDIPAMKNLASLLKVKGKKLGSTHLSEICKELESISEENFQENAQVLLSDINDELMKVKTALEELGSDKGG